MLEWNDLKLVLTIAREESLTGAAKSLGLSHATIYRQLGRVEERVGALLFTRAKSGYTPTALGEELAKAAKHMESEVLEAERHLIGQDVHPSGTVRITTLDSLLVGVLSPIFSDFQRAHSEISLEVVVTNELHNLTRREADIAIRPSNALPENLIGRKLARLHYAVYGHTDLALVSSSLYDHPWLGPDDTMHYPDLEKWMQVQNVEHLCRYRINSVLAMHAAVADQQGLAVLPCYLGDPDARLTRFSARLPELEIDLWQLTHGDIRHANRIRTLLDYVAQNIKKKRLLLAGKI